MEKSLFSSFEAMKLLKQSLHRPNHLGEVLVQIFLSKQFQLLNFEIFQIISGSESDGEPFKIF